MRQNAVSYSVYDLLDVTAHEDNLDKLEVYRYIFYAVIAVVCAIAAQYILWRKCHTHFVLQSPKSN